MGPLVENIDLEITFLGECDAIDCSQVIEGFSESDNGEIEHRGSTTTIECLCKYIVDCSRQIRRAAELIERMNEK